MWIRRIVGSQLYVDPTRLAPHQQAELEQIEELTVQMRLSKSRRGFECGAVHLDQRANQENLCRLVSLSQIQSLLSSEQLARNQKKASEWKQTDYVENSWIMLLQTLEEMVYLFYYFLFLFYLISPYFNSYKINKTIFKTKKLKKKPKKFSSGSE